ncbi:protein of unknown function (DUF4352) [Rubrobacter radiotolerans]|uniref:DUF4352 domain-containing protein n=1 Tax=Rubrobacter radiotolerans TaxID=42256 RepID=A0A023X117_RUBRA|nr:DUF4352 domain-containing protein [Rubrobacter radiotolerans]AHY45705.1 protein of unknown function (DUF4352) [Rubrobacter radiotolerans]MDX5893120.1 DUF4352 domain-containing protein [Rubrobacter radiotolerans]SMC03095.1 protein of unknown function [Rubrobacter radiotolerans DSM 5868]
MKISPSRIIRLAVLVSAGILSVLATACMDLTDETASEEAPARQETVVVERTVEVPERREEQDGGSPDSTCEVGRECEVGGSTVEVTSVQETQTINTSLGDTFEGEFVIVEFDYTYGGSEPVDLGEPTFRLRDGSGSEYSADFDVTSAYGIDNDRSLTFETVQPGVSSPGVVVFEVAPSARDFTLLAADLVSPREVVEIPVEDGDGTGSSSGTGSSGSGSSEAATSASSVSPASVTASSTSAPAPDASGNTVTYEPQKVADGLSDTAWNVDGNGIGQSVTLRYDAPVRVNRVGMIPGYAKVDPADGLDRFFQLYSVRTAEIALSNGYVTTASFVREPGMQFTSLPETETDYVRITILDTYPPQTVSPYGDVYPYTLDKTAISEVRVEGP